MDNNVFKQIKHQGDNFSYITADEATKEATVVDPSFNAEIVTKILEEQCFQPKFITNTHEHGDHTADN